MKIPYIKPEKIWLKGHPELNEKWVQEIIAEDPSILGLGDLILKDKERIQPRAGRLDLLLQDSESTRRYEVEVQLGRTDECHIIRTIEYWDIERKRYPQYEHTAVIVAEDVTSRFLNVINLFHGAIPLIAIQMNAIKIEGKMYCDYHVAVKKKDKQRIKDSGRVAILLNMAKGIDTEMLSGCKIVSDLHLEQLEFKGEL